MSTLRLPVSFALIMYAVSLLAVEVVPDNPVFARINERTIPYDEFMDIFRSAVRYKYYHGEVPLNELVNFKRRVGKDIIEQELLYQLALRSNIKPDTINILKAIAVYEKKLLANKGWQAQKDKNMALLRTRLERRNVIEKIQNRIRDIEKPELREVEQYYVSHPEKFLEPTRLWLSLILLPVAPASPQEVWIDTDRVSRALIERVNQGEKFDEVARKYSSHPSAENGGDLGYIHQGMLEVEVGKAVGKLNITEISEPVNLLEGVAIFRLNGVKPEQMKSFEQVKERAARLLYREMQDDAWQNYLNKSIQMAHIVVNEKLYASTDE